MQVDRFLTPTGLGVFPWFVGDTGASGWAFAARFYDVPQVALVPVADLVAFGPVDAPVCRHAAAPDAVPVVSRVRRSPCEDCMVVETWAMSTDAWVELEAAVTLAHRLAWLRAFPSPAAAAAVEWVRRGVDGYFTDLYVDSRRRLDPLLAAAAAQVALVPAAVEWGPWVRAAVPWSFADDAGMWAHVVASGGSDAHADAYLSWWGVDVAGRPVGAGATDGPLTRYVVVGPQRQHSEWDPMTDELLVQMLGGAAPRVVAAVPADVADAVSRLAQLHVVRGVSVVDPAWLSDAAAGRPVSHAVASAASDLWGRATKDTCMGSVYDCLEVAASLHDDPVAFDTASRLTPEWAGTGRELVVSARALARQGPARTLGVSR